MEDDEYNVKRRTDTQEKKRKKTQSESNLSDYGDLVCRVPGGGSDCESDKEGCGLL